MLPKAPGVEDGAAPPAKPAPEQHGQKGMADIIYFSCTGDRETAGFFQAPCQRYPLPTQEISFLQSCPGPFCIPQASTPCSALIVPAFTALGATALR